jgi:hypothetical protein
MVVQIIFSYAYVLNANSRCVLEFSTDYTVREGVLQVTSFHCSVCGNTRMTVHSVKKTEYGVSKSKRMSEQNASQYKF